MRKIVASELWLVVAVGIKLRENRVGFHGGSVQCEIGDGKGRTDIEAVM